MPEAEHPSAVAGVFHRPFTEQVAFFRRKLGNLVPTARWDDLEPEAHDDAFMVAGAAKADLLTDLAAAVDKAIAEGRGIEEFRRDFKAIVARNGWTGWTGEGSVKGEAWRVKTILRTNAYSSYAAGRMAQLREGGFKYWVYRHGGSLEPRVMHLSWNGLYLPADHPAWAKLYPPNDWGCSCYVVGARTEAGAKRMGGDPAKTLQPGWEAGIGKGWTYAPGANVSDKVSAMAKKVGSWDHRVGKAYFETLPVSRADALADAYRRLPSTADDARRWAQRVYDGTERGTEDMAPLPPVQTLGRVGSDQVAEIAKLGGGAVDGFDFVIDAELTAHIKNRHGPATKEPVPIEPDDFALLPQILSSPDAVVEGEDSALGNLKRVLYRKALNGRLYEAVMEIRGGRKSLYLKSFYVVRKL